MSLIKKIKNKIIKELIFIILKFGIFKNKLFDKIFFILLKFSGENIYYTKQKEKELILSRIKFVKNKKYKTENIFDDNVEKISNEIKTTGICSEMNVNVPDEEVQEVITYFDKKHFYDSHTPHEENKREYGEKPSGAYMSYDNNTQLNCTPLLKLCLNEQIVQIAQSYLGCLPKLFSINTFRTLPNQKAFTHGFHRDLDDFLWLTVFIYWTDTSIDDGAFEQIKFTHRPTEELYQIIEKNFNGINYDDFYKSTLGYSEKKYEDYVKLFGKDNILRVFGKRGKVVAADTAALHRGTSVKKDRLVTWIRYGVTGSRQKNYSYKKDVNFTQQNKSLFDNSKFKVVLEDLV